MTTHSPHRKRSGRRAATPLSATVAIAAGILAILGALPPPARASEEPRRAEASRPQDRVESRSESPRATAPRSSATPRSPAGTTRPPAGASSGGSGRTRVDDVATGRRGSSRFGHRYSSWHYWPHVYWGYGYWGFPYYSYSPYGGGGYGRGYAYRGYGEQGALDLDLRPGKTEIYLDGQYIGIADQYDGFPTYLWLEKGTYDLVFYLPGYRTLARQYSIYPGLVIGVNDRLEPGESILPEDLPAKTHERRDARIQQDRETAAQAEDWSRRDDGYLPRRGAVDARSEPARLEITVEPGDASVYLDGRFVGTGDELARLRGGLIVDPGEHLLEVVRPGHQSRSERLTAEAGETLEVDVELEEGPDGG